MAEYSDSLSARYLVNKQELHPIVEKDIKIYRHYVKNVEIWYGDAPGQNLKLCM